MQEKTTIAWQGNTKNRLAISAGIIFKKTSALPYFSAAPSKIIAAAQNIPSILERQYFFHLAVSLKGIISPNKS
ncbi:MAG: hypothetical protein MUO63_03685 [Desulfobulbaceae bacterium]|nr:hypothetical protein [Desulfobulbaceae bacterium]